MLSTKRDKRTVVGATVATILVVFALHERYHPSFASVSHPEKWFPSRTQVPFSETDIWSEPSNDSISTVTSMPLISTAVWQQLESSTTSTIALTTTTSSPPNIPTALGSYSNKTATNSSYIGVNSKPKETFIKPSLAKVSMLWDANATSVYHQALKTQQDHAARYKYPFYILEREIVRSCHNDSEECRVANAHSLAGTWNKILYLHSLLTSELSKPAIERVDWLMWQDGDTLTLNPSIDYSIFLPPASLPTSLASNIHLLVTHDHNGLNNGVFFIRVSEWSVKYLLACLSIPAANPTADLGWNYEQDAMSSVMKYNKEFNQGQAVRQPKTWYNSYAIPELSDVRKGHVNVHFPGVGEPRKTGIVTTWLKKLEEERDGWNVDAEGTGILTEVEKFWTDYALRRNANGEARE